MPIDDSDPESLLSVTPAVPPSAAGRAGRGLDRGAATPMLGPGGRRALGLAHMTMLETPPPELVTVAAASGFDFVSVRVSTSGPSEEPWPIWPGSSMMRETLLRLTDTGLTVLDVDILPIRATTTVADTEPAMLAAAVLGAQFFTVLVDDENLDRAADTFAALAPVAAAHGLRLIIEPMPYKKVRSLEQAVVMARRARGCGVMVDALHFRRFAGDWDALGALHDREPELFPYIQFCDAPLSPPVHLPEPVQLPRGQAPGTTIAQLEARAWRLPPGEGQLPLRRLAETIPDVPISVEAPNVRLTRELSPAALSDRLYAGVCEVLAGGGVRASRRPADTVTV